METNPQELVELWFRRRNYERNDFGYSTSKWSWGAWGLIGPYRRQDAESSAATFKQINKHQDYEVRPMRLPCPYANELTPEVQQELKEMAK